MTPYPSFSSQPFSPSFHFDTSFPSNSTTASAGGPPTGPGSTTAGSGQTIPLLYSLVWTAARVPATATAAPTPAATNHAAHFRTGAISVSPEVSGIGPGLRGCCSPDRPPG